MGYSVQSAQSGSWTPSLSGWLTLPTINVSDFVLTPAKVCTVWVDMVVNTSNSTTTTITMPYASRIKARFPIAVTSGGSGVAGFIDLAAGSNVGTIFLASGAGLSATGTKGSTFSISYPIQ